VEQRSYAQDCGVETGPHEEFLGHGLRLTKPAGTGVRGRRHRHDDHVRPLPRLHKGRCEVGGGRYDAGVDRVGEVHGGYTVHGWDNGTAVVQVSDHRRCAPRAQRRGPFVIAAGKNTHLTAVGDEAVNHGGTRAAVCAGCTDYQDNGSSFHPPLIRSHHAT